MDLISLIVMLIVVGLILWLVQTYLPIDATIKRIIVIVVILFVIIWLIRALGINLTI